MILRQRRSTQQPPFARSKVGAAYQAGRGRALFLSFRRDISFRGGGGRGGEGPTPDHRAVLLLFALRGNGILIPSHLPHAAR